MLVDIVEGKAGYDQDDRQDHKPQKSMSRAKGLYADSSIRVPLDCP